MIPWHPGGLRRRSADAHLPDWYAQLSTDQRVAFWERRRRTNRRISDTYLVLAAVEAGFAVWMAHTETPVVLGIFVGASACALFLAAWFAQLTRQARRMAAMLRDR